MSAAERGSVFVIFVSPNLLAVTVQLLAVSELIWVSRLRRELLGADQRVWRRDAIVAAA